MQTFTIQRFKSPSGSNNSGFLSLIRLFKFELIKIFVFLLLFAASVFIANGQSEEYYKPAENIHQNMPSGNSSMEVPRSRN